jgi:hypothetical protein
MSGGRRNDFPLIGLLLRGDEFASQYPNWLWFWMTLSDRGLFHIAGRGMSDEAAPLPAALDRHRAGSADVRGRGDDGTTTHLPSKASLPAGRSQAPQIGYYSAGTLSVLLSGFCLATSHPTNAAPPSRMSSWLLSPYRTRFAALSTASSAQAVEHYECRDTARFGPGLRNSD